MRTYIVKRLLIMIPTFFGISLIIFVVLNFAPGRPGSTKQAQDLASMVRGEKTQESYRIFREQFNLDKPVLLNTLFALSEERVRECIKLFADSNSTSAQRIRAQQTLEDYGEYAVPALISILRASSERAANPAAESGAPDEGRFLADAALERDMAVYFLRLNARRRLIDPLNKNLAPALREENRRRDAENAQIRGMRYALEDSEDTKQAVVEQWLAWHRERQSRWEHTLLDKARIFFLDTRFATYWRNLLRLDFGVSLVTREPVLATLFSKLKYSLSLSVVSILLAYAISIPLGIASAVRKDSLGDRATTVVLFLLYSLPSFFVGTVLLLYLTKASKFEWLRWFPIGGWRSANYWSMTGWEQIGNVATHLALPLACLTYGSLAALSRYMRAAFPNGR